MSSVEERLGFLGGRARLLRDGLARYDVEYMFIGKGAAIAVGLNATTKDLDIYPSKTPENCLNLVKALKEIGFPMERELRGRKVDLESQLLEGRDFVQFLEPFDLDVVFGPDGFENYEEASQFKVVKEGYPLLSIDGLIQSKKAAGRDRDLQDLPLLYAFRDWYRGQQ